jgi:bla regulator protein blaR1
MTAYLLKSGFCLLVSLILYKCVLENEKMHRFNRFYLLSSVGISLLAPLVSFTLQPETSPLANVAPVLFVEHNWQTALNQVTVQPQVAQSVTDFWSITYWIITVLLLGRFGQNIYALFGRINRHPTVPFRSARVVLLPEHTLPHTFLHYLFVNQEAYEKGTIEDELFTHELAHIRQRHSVDILLFELVICFFWFNPVLIWFKRAIQLNHEFLADDAVIDNRSNVVSYQHLLLSKLTHDPPVFLTSTLTFQTTKQRFKMMNKQTSFAKTLMVAISAMLTLAILIMAVSTQIVAQTAPTPNQAKPTVANKRQSKIDVAEMERLYGDKLVILPNLDNHRAAPRKKFSDLTDEQKKRVIYLAPEARKTPTEAEFTAWKNPKKYGIWVDEKRTRNFANTTLKASDIVAYSGSYVHKNARQPEGYLYQMDLMRNQHYEAYLKEQTESPFLILVNNVPKDR